jgi:hypothetical protein
LGVDRAEPRARDSWDAVEGKETRHPGHQHAAALAGQANCALACQHPYTQQGRDFASSEEDSEDDAPRRRAGGRGAGGRGGAAAGRGAGGRGAGGRGAGRPGMPSGLQHMSRPGSASDDGGTGEFDAAAAAGLMGVAPLSLMLGGGSGGMLSPRLFQALGDHAHDQSELSGAGGPEGGVPLPCIEGSWGIPLLLPDGAQLVPLQPSLLGPLGAGNGPLVSAMQLMPSADGGQGAHPLPDGVHCLDGPLPVALPLVSADGAPAPGQTAPGLAGLPLFEMSAAGGGDAGAAAGLSRPVCEPPLAVLPLALGAAVAGDRCAVGLLGGWGAHVRSRGHSSP